MTLATAMTKSGFTALRARDAGLLPAALSETGVLLVGAGSVGSQMADSLVRGGIGDLAVIDHDQVEPHNLSRTLYGTDDIGKAKAPALATILRRIHKDITITSHPYALQEMPRAILQAAVNDAHLIVAATDDPAAQRLVNRISQHNKKPALFVGLYRGAKGGEVVISVPGLTPCFECYAGAARFTAGTNNPVAREKDYGTQRLKAEPGLASDIRLVSAAAVKIALSLLAAHVRDPASSGAEFIIKALEARHSVVLFGMEPDYWLFPQAMRDAAGQYAFQSVWLGVERNPDCPACGPDRYQDDPIATMRGRVDATAINAEMEVERCGSRI